jgi:uncharacterized protein (DUF1684 family)
MQPSQISLIDWRRQVNEMYAAVRAAADPEAAHARWREERDRLFREHPQTPLLENDPLRETGLPYWPYDPSLRFEAALLPVEPTEDRRVDVGDDGTLTMRLIGRVELPSPMDGALDVWWLRQYGGGMFVPLRDGTSGDGSYGGGRYLLDTAKGSWLGGDGDSIILDLNYAYHPSCRYNPRWQCPLAPPGNTITARIEAGERL